MMGPNECHHDYHLNPVFHTCRGVHDFSIKFEKIFLSIVPTSLFIIFAVARLSCLVGKPTIVHGTVFRFIKIGAFLALATLQVSLVPFFARDHDGPLHGLSLGAKSLDAVIAVCLGGLSAFEHSASPHPSTALNLYHVISILCDVVHIRTSWLMVDDPTQLIASRVTLAIILVKALCLVLENWSKSKWLQLHVHHHSPEEFSNIFSKGLFVWLRPLLFNGYTTVLGVHDLYPLDEELSAESAQNWMPDQAQLRTRSIYALGWHLVRHLGVSFLLPVLPRLAQAVFYYSQPILTRALLEHLDPKKSPSPVAGHGLIAAGVLISVGGTLSRAWYGYYLVRFKTKIRSCLCTAMYRKLSETKPVAGHSLDDGAQIVTLLGADVERTCEGLAILHELWALPLEVAVGLWLLYRELGLAFVIAIVVAGVCLIATVVLARHARKHQTALMSAMQARVTLTTGIIDNIRSLHMTGLAACLPGIVHTARAVEVAASIRWNLFIVLISLLGSVPLTLTPLLTFAATSSALDVPTIFASLSTLSILCYPLNLICQSLLTLQAAFTCLKRIQSYLVSESRHDPRLIEPPAFGIAVSIQDGSFGWTDETLILTDVNITVPAQQITMITGPVASGKTTLCKSILGEVPVLDGQVVVRSAYSGIGFCDQTPFLVNTTIAHSIVGDSHLDEARFKEAVWATKMDEDIQLFPEGRNATIGPGGNMLSGGQKQRLSLARALYLESDLLIVDDIFSALDADTGSQVFERVFGPEGIVRRRRMTAILCTGSPVHLRCADQILTIGPDGMIASSGSSEASEDEKVPSSWPIIQKELAASTEEKARFSKVDHSFRTSVIKVADADSGSFQRQTNMGDYLLYAKQTGAWPLLVIILVAILFSALQNCGIFWTTQWSQDLLKKPLSFYLGIYAVFQCSMLLATVAENLVQHVTITRRAAMGFHKHAIGALLAAPLSMFTGKDKDRILTLFSKDMRVINEEIPGPATKACHKGVQVIGMAIVMCLATPWLAISYPILVLVVFIIKRVFLRTCWQMNLLDLEFRGPLNTHSLDTIKGIATIRAFGWSSSQIQHNNRLLNTSQRPAYLSGMLQQWLDLTLRMVSAGVSIAAITLATQLRANAALTGAALVTLTIFSSGLAGFVRSFANLEVRMGSVHRLKAFYEENSLSNGPSNEPADDPPAEPNWPWSGGIELAGVSASYGNNDDDAGEEAPLAINGLTLSIRAGEKLAITGRTGSGKTSIVLLLLRLLEPLPSSSPGVLIDGTPLDQIDSPKLRKGIIAVPQDPVFLPAGTSMKQNLDPLNEASDEECIAVLQVVGLSHLLAVGLDNEMRAESLSTGEQKLFALGRAVLRCRVRKRNLLKQGYLPGGIVLLDEIIFADDENTQSIIQPVIEDEFKNYTIIMVSHQLRLVDELFERVIVMDEGRLVEMGDPRELKDRVGGRYAQLWTLWRDKMAE